MKKKSIIHIIFLILCHAKSSFAQYIQGIVIDKTTQKALSGASVKFQNRGIISNNKGEFRINLKGANSFKVSYIGYKTVETLISNPQVHYTIELEESDSDLQEVIVNSNAISIVNKAFQQIQNNYSQRDFTTKGFLSEYNRFDKNNYIYAIDAFLKTTTKSYNTDKSPDIEAMSFS